MARRKRSVAPIVAAEAGVAVSVPVAVAPIAAGSQTKVPLTTQGSPLPSSSNSRGLNNGGQATPDTERGGPSATVGAAEGDGPPPDLLIEALMLRESGFSVIPLHAPGMPLPEGFTDGEAGKGPLIAWKGYQKRPATEDEVCQWWARWPHANIGVVTGAVSGVFVLDVDRSEGLHTLKSLPPVPETWRSATGRGQHVWFRHPGRRVRTV